MLLTKTQKKILELIREYGGMKAEMLKKLCDSQWWFENELKRLSQLGRLFETEGYYCDECKVICGRDTETAFEVMLAASAKPPEMFFTGNPPFALTFFKERGDKLYRYDICVAARGKEAYITAAAEACNLKSRVVIFVIEDERQIPFFKIHGEYRFALKRNEIYHFYGGN